MRREFITKSTSGGCGQFDTSPEEIEQEMLTALCERRQTDRLKTNYRVDETVSELKHENTQDKSRYSIRHLQHYGGFAPMSSVRKNLS